MPYYYVNKNAQTFPENGEHEVHEEGCPTPPLLVNRYGLGYHGNCKLALMAARQIFSKVDGCKNCIPQCHKL